MTGGRDEGERKRRQGDEWGEMERRYERGAKKRGGRCGAPSEDGREGKRMMKGRERNGSRARE